MFGDLEITPEELATLRGSGQPIRLIDVREDWEFEYNRIPGGELLPLHDLEFRHGEVLKQDEVIVCLSQRAALKLRIPVWQ